MLPFRRRRSDQKSVFMHSLRECLKMSCAKFGVDWSRNVHFAGTTRSMCSKPIGVAYAKICHWLQWICAYNVFDCGSFGVGVIAQNAFSEHSIGQIGDRQCRRFLAPPCGEIFNFPKTIFLCQITPAHINNSWPYFLYRLGFAPWWFPLSLKNIPLAN